jgi:ArsR family transcriptional regulator, arsenate/arsenite/antimonite-responsive transcriptional repressor
MGQQEPPPDSSHEFRGPSFGEHHRLTPEDSIELAWRLRALAEPARVSIVSILADREDHAMTTRDLAPLIGLTEATVSHHLKQLTEAGIVDKHRDGARVLYCLNIAAVRALASVLDVCCGSGTATGPMD